MNSSDTDAIVAAAAPSVRPTADDPSLRSFTAEMPQVDIDDLKLRLRRARWPDRETVADDSQGPQLAKLQELVRYWGSGYDWRKAEAKLNAYPQFMTRIDGLDIHFIHVRSRHANALPLVVAHGWPGSVFEQIKLVEPLTDPVKHGGRAEDAFDVVIPSLPGFGFSGHPTEAGWGLERIGAALHVLMKRLGYSSYVAQGGDWGSGVVQAMGRLAPAELRGIHSNLPAAIPPEVEALFHGGPAPKLSPQEGAAVGGLGAFAKSGGLAYIGMMGARPQALGYSLTDSPVGLAGWMLQHSGFAQWNYGQDTSQSPTRDDVLDNITLYWLTNTAASSARIYWENRAGDLISSTAQKTNEIAVPVAITVFPQEVYRPPESWARRAFRNLSYYHEADRGGHFAMWEYPDLFAAELRAAFKSIRTLIT
jgi:pimeloyl-ACP methyl ester carboxylesterase